MKRTTLSSTLLGLGLISAAAAAVSAVRSQRAIDAAAQADGLVVAFEQRTANPSDPREDASEYHPVVRFKVPGDGGAGVIEFVAPVGANPPAYTAGDEVVVLYDPQHPEAARLKAFRSFWLVPLALGAFAGTALALALASRVLLSGSVAGADAEDAEDEVELGSALS